MVGATAGARLSSKDRSSLRQKRCGSRSELGRGLRPPIVGLRRGDPSFAPRAITHEATDLGHCEAVIAPAAPFLPTSCAPRRAREPLLTLFWSNENARLTSQSNDAERPPHHENRRERTRRQRTAENGLNWSPQNATVSSPDNLRKLRVKRQRLMPKSNSRSIP